MVSMILVIYPQQYKLNLLSEANNLQVVPLENSTENI